MAYRNDIITRGHETNNYAEATVRLLKDIMLERRKAFNVVALVGYIITVLEPYYEKRLYEVASGRPSPLLAAFSRLQTTANTVNLNGSVQLEADTYQVTSSSGQNVYIVNIREGVCTCTRGVRGHCANISWHSVSTKNYRCQICQQLHTRSATNCRSLPSVTRLHQKHSS